ncbi:MAG: hypothetical protein IPP16_06520 [Acidimicrobiaceae bacterium]|nr:hypothetical protein [Acidimicrobiaceae bacterium]
MLLRAIGELLPAALGPALNPFPVIAAVLLLAGSQAAAAVRRSRSAG